MKIKGNLLLLSILLMSVFPVYAQQDLDNDLLVDSVDVIQADPELKAHMQSLATTAISEHCAACHSADLTGKTGVPNLVDFDWLWGVTGYEMTYTEPVFEIMQTILYGIRNNNCSDDIKRYGACPDTRFSQMPAYMEMDLTDEQINDLVDYVFSLSGGKYDEAAVERISGTSSLCTECHAEDGTGYKPFGGPDLTDDVWLYGDSREQIKDVITNGRTGTCPAWVNQLSATTIKALAVYIYTQSLGL